MKRTSELSLLMCLVALLVAPAQEAVASNGAGWGWYCDREPVANFWEQDITGQAVTGKAGMCVTPFGIFGSLKARGLTAGNAYTVWWVYVDKPSDCVGFPLTPENSDVPFPEPAGYADNCGFADFFSLDPSGEFLNPLVVYGRMDGVVAYNTRKTWFSGDVRSFVPSPGSQVWMLVFGHGPADETDNRQLARQLLTPEDPLSGVPHLGIEGRPFGYPAAVSVFNIP